ncbi:hypothetical protein CVS40_8788, partial [Lucilia cuprina]
LSKSIKTRPYCPICNNRIVTESSTEGTTGVTTRSKASDQNTTEPSEVLSSSFRGPSTPQVEEDSVSVQPALVPINQNTTNSGSSASNPAVSIIQNDVLKDMITKIVSAQQAQLYSALNSQISSLIESNIQSSLARFSPTIFSNAQTQQQHTQPQPSANLTSPLMRTLPAVEQQTFREMLGLRLLLFRHYTGTFTCYAIMLVLYSKERLMIGSGDFTNEILVLPGLNCAKSFREQYRDSRTDIDFLELIRDRKQKPNESFDSFYEAVNELVDRLKTPIEDTTLVEILRRNLLPDIQHEILNTQIYTVQHLRDVCRRREFFMADIRRKHGVGFSRAPPIHKRISEIDREFMDETEESVVCDGDEVAELNLVCWNCQKPGHRYQDCLSVRTIFCYGCGKADTYKPNCKHCQSKNSKFSAQRCAQKNQSPETEI